MSPSASPSELHTGTLTSTASGSLTGSPSGTGTATATGSPSQTPTPTQTPSNTPSGTGSASWTRTPPRTRTPAPTDTASQSASLSPGASVSSSASPSATPEVVVDAAVTFSVGFAGLSLSAVSDHSVAISLRVALACTAGWPADLVRLDSATSLDDPALVVTFSEGVNNASISCEGLGVAAPLLSAARLGAARAARLGVIRDGRAAQAAARGVSAEDPRAAARLLQGRGLVGSGSSGMTVGFSFVVPASAGGQVTGGAIVDVLTAMREDATASLGDALVTSGFYDFVASADRSIELASLSVAAIAEPVSQPTPPPTATPSASTSGSATATGTPEGTPSPTATLSPGASPTGTPQGTGSSSGTRSVAPSASPSSSPPASRSGSGTRSGTPTGSLSAGASVSTSGTRTASRSLTPARTGTASGTRSASATATVTATLSSGASASGTATGTPSGTGTASTSATASVTPSVTRSRSGSRPASVAVSSTVEPSRPSSSLPLPPATPTAVEPSLSGSRSESVAVSSTVEPSPSSTRTPYRTRSPSGSSGTSPSRSPAVVASSASFSVSVQLRLGGVPVAALRSTDVNVALRNGIACAARLSLTSVTVTQACDSLDCAQNPAADAAGVVVRGTEFAEANRDNGSSCAGSQPRSLGAGRFSRDSDARLLQQRQIASPVYVLFTVTNATLAVTAALTGLSSDGGAALSDALIGAGLLQALAATDATLDLAAVAVSVQSVAAIAAVPSPAPSPASRAGSGRGSSAGGEDRGVIGASIAGALAFAAVVVAFILATRRRRDRRKGAREEARPREAPSRTQRASTAVAVDVPIIAYPLAPGGSGSGVAGLPVLSAASLHISRGGSVPQAAPASPPSPGMAAANLTRRNLQPPHSFGVPVAAAPDGVVAEPNVAVAGVLGLPAASVQHPPGPKAGRSGGDASVGQRSPSQPAVGTFSGFLQSVRSGRPPPYQSAVHPGSVLTVTRGARAGVNSSGSAVPTRPAASAIGSGSQPPHVSLGPAASDPLAVAAAHALLEGPGGRGASASRAGAAVIMMHASPKLTITRRNLPSGSPSSDALPPHLRETGRSPPPTARSRARSPLQEADDVESAPPSPARLVAGQR